MQYQWNSRFRSSRRGVIGSNFWETDKLTADIKHLIHRRRIAGARIERQLVSISLLFAADSLDGHVANVLVEESSHASVEKIESKRHFPK